MTLLEQAEAILDASRVLLDEVNGGRTTITLDEADRLQHIIGEAKGYLIGIERRLEA